MTASNTSTTMTTSTWLMLLVLSIVWGGSFFFQGVAVRELPTLTIVLIRVAGAALVLLAYLKLTGKRMSSSGKVWLAFIGMGVLNNVIPFTLMVWGQSHIASGLASILNATTPFFTLIAAHFLTDDEKINLPKLVGIMLGFLGVFLMIGGDFRDLFGASTLGQLAILCGAFSYALAGIFGKRFRKMGVTPLETATGQVSSSAVMLLPLVFFIDQPWTLPMPSTNALLSLGGLAIISTAFAYFLYFKILEVAGATNLLLVTFLIPVTAILLGTLVLGEVILMKHIIGMTLIGFGLAAIDGRLLKWRTSKRQNNV